jgi:hypothetical protein
MRVAEGEEAVSAAGGGAAAAQAQRARVAAHVVQQAHCQRTPARRRDARRVRGDARGGGHLLWGQRRRRPCCARRRARECCKGAHVTTDAPPLPPLMMSQDREACARGRPGGRVWAVECQWRGAVTVRLAFGGGVFEACAGCNQRAAGGVKLPLQAV